MKVKNIYKTKVIQIFHAKNGFQLITDTTNDSTVTHYFKQY